MIKQKFLAFILMYCVGLLFLPSFAGPLHAAGDDDDSDSSMRLEEKETIRKTFNLTAAHKILEIDNIFGSIEVTGGRATRFSWWSIRRSLLSPKTAWTRPKKKSRSISPISRIS